MKMFRKLEGLDVSTVTHSFGTQYGAVPCLYLLLLKITQARVGAGTVTPESSRK